MVAAPSYISTNSVGFHFPTPSPASLIFSLYGPGGSDGKESAHNVGDLGSIPVSGRSPGEMNGYLLQYSCTIIFLSIEE